MFMAPSAAIGHEVWHTVIWLKGTACYTAEKWPVPVCCKSDEEGSVDMLINEPVPGDIILGRETVKQRLDLTVTAAESVVQNLVFKAVSTLADTLSFATSRRVEFALASLTTAPPGVNQGDFKTIVTFNPVVLTDAPLGLDVVYLQPMMRQLGDLTSDRSRRILRSMRWLRRSYTTPDAVLGFSALMFSLEALVSLLPAPPSPSLDKKQKKKNQKPGTTDKLKHFAVVYAQASENTWKFVGKLRHELVHGDIQEDLEENDHLLQAIPLLRRVVVMALKHALSIPVDRLPAVPPNLSGVGIPRVVFSTVLRTSETES
jgi:hypothetical protein